MSNIFSSPLVLESVFRDVFRDVFDEGIALSAYAVAGLDPALVFDFDDEYYRTGGSTSTFSSAITHSRNSNATMVDSDGLLKWGPHNLLTWSEDFSNAAWTKDFTPTITQNELGPDGVANSAWTITDDSATNREGITRIGSTISGLSGTATYDYFVVVKKTTAASSFPGIQLFLGGGTTQNGAVTINTDTGTLTDRTSFAPTSSSSVLIETASGDWWLVGIRMTLNGTNTYLQPEFYPAIAASDTGTWDNTQTGSSILYCAFVHRSDLGGMVSVPEDARAFPSATTYVPTTSSARYLARRGHHIWNGTAWVNEGMLHESEARTNLLTYSSEFDNAAWSNANATVTANTVVAPDGTTTADTFAATNTAYSSVFQTVTTVASTTYTASVYAKAGTASTLSLEFRGSGTTPDAVFDLSTGAVTSGTGTIEDAGNGWYRCSITKAAVDTSELLIIGRGVSGLTGDSIYIYGAQLEAGSTPSSYIPTSGATVTRAADTLTVPSANLPWSSDAVSIQMQGRVSHAADGSVTVGFMRWRIDSNSRIETYVTTQSGVPANNDVFFLQTAAGVTDLVFANDSAPAVGVNVPFNIASRHGSTFINGAVDGTALTADTTPVALPDLSSTDLNLGFDYMGTIKLFRIWAADLADAGIAEAST